LAEKPFGTNLKEAKKLDLLGHRLFKEVQLYRIDHYLAKEMLQNIMMFRFSNNLFEGIWNNKFIEKIEAKINESIDIEGRGNFYDKVGALLDVGQNHLLQMLALTTMDRPKEASAEMIREKRAKIMDNLKRLANAEIKSQTVRGQYQGYLDEAGVAVGSKTETYFKIKTYLETPRWRGVPIFLEGGKKLPNVDKEIIVTFRHIAPCLCPPGQHYKNQIYFRIQPEPAIAVKFWSKIPGTAMGLEEQFLSYRYPKREGQKRYLEEYTKLILDAISGDQTLFVSSAEVMAGWRFVDPIISAWRKNAVPLEIYGRNDNILKLSRVIEES
jgi:glucose-6-phosphate 1-dehydrogenase